MELAAFRLSTKMSKFAEIFWMMLKSLKMPGIGVDLHWKCVMSKMEQIRTNWMNFRRNMAVFDRLLASFADRSVTPPQYGYNGGIT